MARKTERLTIRSHHDACMLSNAIREHGEKQTGAYQSAFVKAKDEGRETDATRYLQWRMDADRCWHDIVQQLDAIIRRFENTFDDSRDQDTIGGPSYGPSTDHATCYN